MYKNATFKEKFTDIQEWLPLLIEAVKKDLKNDHLKKDFNFIKNYLPSKNINKVTTEELVEAYQKAIHESEAGENLAEFITSRWIIKNSDIYEFFESQLSQIYSDFANLEEIEEKSAQSLIDASIHQFGAPHTYLFSVLNSVVFPKNSFHELKKRAQQHREKENEENLIAAEQRQIAQVQRNMDLELARLTDKYEKKISGLQKKYVTDVENLKKQIAQLQRKLHEKTHS